MNKKEFKYGANAKINLSLEILHKRQDGYHELNTLFAPVSITDRIDFCFTDSPGIDIRTTVNLDPDNIIEKAINLFLESFKIEQIGVQVHLEKNIPIGAGLGGGSSDAAFTLRALSEYFSIGDIGDLLPIATRLGSDVPFFLFNRAALGSGKGEILYPVDTGLPYRAVLVNPGIHISTPEAYSMLNPESTRTPVLTRENINFILADKLLWSEYFRNDFETIIFKKYPLIEEIKRNLKKSGAFFALMSGSGSTVFGIFEDNSAAESAAQQLRNLYPDFYVQNCSLSID